MWVSAARRLGCAFSWGTLEGGFVVPIGSSPFSEHCRRLARAAFAPARERTGQRWGRNGKIARLAVTPASPHSCRDHHNRRTPRAHLEIPMIARAVRIFLGITLLVSATAIDAQPRAGRPARYEDLVALFNEWRAFQRPKIVNG